LDGLSLASLRGSLPRAVLQRGNFQHTNRRMTECSVVWQSAEDLMK